MTATVHLSYRANGVAILELDNPPVNALGDGMLAELAALLEEALNRADVRAVILTARGRAFSGGADLKVRSSADGAEEPAFLMEVLAAVRGARVPIIAAINGHCIGAGLELALSCDVRVASSRATFVCAGANVGLLASAYRLPQLIGTSRAKAMLLTGATFDADTSERWGLVTEVHDPDQLLDAALRLAERIATRAPLSVEAIKRVVDRTGSLSPAEAEEVEASELSLLLKTQDHREALTAFRDKRKPQFSRR